MDGLSLSTRGHIIPNAVNYSTLVPISPAEAQSLLVRALDIPLPSNMTEALGIHQSDVIIRSCIVAGIAAIRAEPWLLDYVFASLPKDSMTMAAYGEKEVDNAKKWFLQTDIQVLMDYTPTEAKLPAISIQLVESTEQENTLGDIHYQPQEDTNTNWPILFGSFRPVAYSASAGVMKLPPVDTSSLVLNTDMYIVDTIGKSYPILEVLDDSTIRIKAGIVADFSSTSVRFSKPIMVTRLESLSFKETYRLGCHTTGEPVHLTYLHSILTFVLLAYKEVMLEARGFERSVISSGEFVRNDALDVELAYSRSITITGYVRNYWPKMTQPRIQGAEAQSKISKVGSIGTKYEKGSDEDEGWLAEIDGIGVDANGDK
jgi:hypothetical protein